MMELNRGSCRRSAIVTVFVWSPLVFGIIRFFFPFIFPSFFCFVFLFFFLPFFLFYLFSLSLSLSLSLSFFFFFPFTFGFSVLLTFFPYGSKPAKRIDRWYSYFDLSIDLLVLSSHLLINWPVQSLDLYYGGGKCPTGAHWSELTVGKR